MTMCCILCGRSSEDATDISFYTFPENEYCRKKWLDAIGKIDTEVPAQSLLCSRHFPQSCFEGSILMDNAVPTLELESRFTDPIAKAVEEDRLASPEEPQAMRLWPLSRCVSQITRPTISKGRRIHMLSDEEMKEMQPIKYVRFLKNVDWDEISKIPAEAKIVWEVAMEELKENNDKIKHLQVQVHQLNATIRKLRNALKTRTKRAGIANSSR